VTAISTSDLDPQPLAARPANSVLQPGRLRADGYDLLPHWSDAMLRLVQAVLEENPRVER